jgi:gamma-glutamyltranspeptidase/glutathione hydrolase
MIGCCRALLALAALCLSCAGTEVTRAPSSHAFIAAPALRASPGAAPEPLKSAPPPRWPAEWPYQNPVVVSSAQGMVVTDNALASQVGRDTLASGGNAADAAIATAFALAVAYPRAGNIGGGGFAVAHFDGHSYALDFRETAPGAASHDMFKSANHLAQSAASHGILSSGVPGTVAGLWELYQRLGSKRKTWAELLGAARLIAEAGLAVDPAFQQGLSDAAGRLKKYPSSRALFFPTHAPLAKGSTWKNPELASALGRIAAEGPNGFYRGKTAQALVAEMKRRGGLITHGDLQNYQAKWREPLRLTYRGASIIAMPPPSSGGVTLGLLCHILQGYDLGQLGYQTPQALHVIIEAQRRAFAARNAYLGDPDYVKLPLDVLLGADWAAAQRATITADRATPSADIGTADSPGGGSHTTHMSVVDAQGNAVALTTTLNDWYGSGITVTGAGFLLNNEMDDFASVPGQANAFGLVQGEANSIAPGKRMLSSMSPSIVTGPDGKVQLILGAAGGPTIITAVFDELSNVLDYGLDPGSAVYAPRIHMQHAPDIVTVEPHGITEDTKIRLQAMGYTIETREHLADAPLIGRAGNLWVGVAEPRRLGALALGP